MNETVLRKLVDEVRQGREEPAGQPDYAGMVFEMVFEEAPPCWSCGATMTETRDIYGRDLWACWSCAKTI